jgi:hypothetical protein
MVKCIDCDKRAYFNVIGCSIGLYCKTHATPDMVNVISKTCVDCDKRASFNVIGCSIGLYCKTHATPDMVNVISKTCVDCDKQASFNVIGCSIGLYCKTHAKPDMIDIIHKKCIDCDKRASFNVIGCSIGLYCKTHAKPDMICVTSKKCIDCDKHASFNVIGSKSVLYCKTHAKPDMICITHKKCIDCDTRASYGFPMQKPTHCACHRQVGMLPHPRSKCKTDDCKEFAFFGYTRQVACEKHALSDMYNLVERPCVNCGLLEVLDSSNFCGNCHDFVVKRQHLAKQRDVFHYLEAHGQQAEQKDRRIDNGACGNERPDWICHGSNDARHTVVLEIDEDQHKSNQCSCEIARMINISQSIGMPTLFIRYNPDSFKDHNGKNAKISDMKRKELLLKWIEHCKTLHPTSSADFLRVIYLFYDGFNPNNVSIQSIAI